MVLDFSFDEIIVDKPSFSLGLGHIQEVVACFTPTSYCKNTRGQKKESPLKPHWKAKKKQLIKLNQLVVSPPLLLRDR